MEEKQEEKSEEKPEENSTPVIDAARLENDRKETLLKEESELLKRRESLMARQELGGNSEGGMPAPKPEEVSAKEYSEKLDRGEVNPLKEDGFI